MDHVVDDVYFESARMRAQKIVSYYKNCYFYVVKKLFIIKRFYSL